MQSTRPARLAAAPGVHPAGDTAGDLGWGNFVDFEQGLNVCIRQIRAALSDDSEKPRYIETLPRRGYRFIGEPHGLPTAGVDATVVAATETMPVAISSVLRRAFLRHPLPIAVGLAVLLAAVVFAWRIERRRLSVSDLRPTIRSIAVLPLVNLSHDPEQDYFAEGMTDELITNLAKISALRVISRTSVMRYRNVQRPIAEIGKELGVDAVIEGTIVRSADKVRITVQLIHVPTDRHLWAEEYERDLRDVLALQSGVARAITNAVEVKLTPLQERRLASARRVDPEAHDAYLRGLYLLHRHNPGNAEKAIGFFQQAISKQSDYALAYSALADAHYAVSSFSRAPLDVMPKAKAAAARAVELDDTLADAHASMGFIRLFFDWDWPDAEREFRRALELNPNLTKAHMGYAAYLGSLGHAPESIAEVERAYQLDPVSPDARDDGLWYFITARHYEQAVERCRWASELEPTDDQAYAWLSVAETLLGRYPEAVAAADRAVQLSASRPPPEAAYVYAKAGQKQKARGVVKALLDPTGQPYVCGYSMAFISLALGEKDRALNWLEKAYLDRSD